MKLKYLPFLLLSVFALVACSDDDDNPVVCPVETEKSFSGSELDLKVSGNKVIGKEILFTPDANNPAATLTFRGEKLNVEELINNGTHEAAADATFKTSSVFAGEPEVVLPVTMTLNGDLGSFNGSGESKFYTFNYSGNVLENQLSIELTDVALKNQKFAGTSWTLAPIVVNDFGMVESVPTNFIWESDKKVAIEMFGQTTEYSMTQLMAVVMSIGVVPGADGKKMTIPEVLASMLQGVQFEGDGNLIATYVDLKTKQPKTSPKGLAQYVVASDNLMKLVLNPYAIAADAAANKGEADKEPSQMAEIMRGLTPSILKALDADKRLSEGIDIAYTLDGDKLYVCIDQQLLLPVLQMFAPMLQNPDLIKTITDKVKENPDMAAMAPMLESLLKQFPEVVNTTTKMEIGLNFVKK